MEIYVMKKRFVLVLALILLVASASLFADPTHVTVTGKARIGYKFTFTDGSNPASASAKTNIIYLDSLAVKGDVFKVSFSDVLGASSDDDWDSKGTAEIYVDKVAKAAGNDWGDFTLTIGGGNKTNASAPIVYSDPNSTVSDNNYARLRMTGTYVAYANIGYTKMFSLYVSYTPIDWNTDNKTYPIMASAMVAPVDGVSFTAGWTAYANRKAVAGDYKKGAIGGSVLVDVKKLAKLDFDLKASAIDTLYLDDSDSATDQAANDLLAAVSGGMSSWAAYVEFQSFGNAVKDGKSKFNAIGKFTYKGIKNVSLYGKYTMNDIAERDGNKINIIGFGGSYAMAPLTFAADASITLQKDAKTSFSITPYCTIVF